MNILFNKNKKCTRRIFLLLIIFLGSVIFGIFFREKKTVLAAGCKYPAEVLNLTNWKQTLPIGSSRKPKEITPSSLGTYIHNLFFRTNTECTGVVFRAPVNGVTTSNSGYPRSELREMASNGKSLANWSTTAGTHTMTIDQAITAVPKVKKHVVAGQIHNADDDVIVIRLEYPKLFVDINGKSGPTLDANYTLGKRFSVKFEASNGKIKTYYNGSAKPVHTLTKKGSGNYFKAGAYIQSNCSKEKKKACNDNNYGEVVIYKLLVQHGNKVADASFDNANKDLVSSSEPAFESISDSILPVANAETMEDESQIAKTSVQVAEPDQNVSESTLQKLEENNSADSENKETSKQWFALGKYLISIFTERFNAYWNSFFA